MTVGKRNSTRPAKKQLDVFGISMKLNTCTPEIPAKHLDNYEGKCTFFAIDGHINENHDTWGDIVFRPFSLNPNKQFDIVSQMESLSFSSVAVGQNVCLSNTGGLQVGLCVFIP